MKRLLFFVALVSLSLGQMCAPPPSNDDTGNGMNGDDTPDVGEPVDDSSNDMPGDDSGDLGDNVDDDAGTHDPADDTPPPDDAGTDDGTQDDSTGDDNGDTGDDVTDPPPAQGGGGTGSGGDDPPTGPCTGVNFTGTWTDGDRLFELTQSGNTITSRFAEPFLCDHEDGEGTTSTTDEDFTATLSGDCTITGTIAVCRFGCTVGAGDCSVDQNGITTVPFEGEASEQGDAISIDFTDPLTGDSFSLLYTLEP